MVKEKQFDMALFFAALADRTRLRLINLIRDDEVCVCFLVEAIGTNQPKISRHLAYLKKAGLAASRRVGNWAHYHLTEPGNIDARKLFNSVRESLKSDPEMRADRSRLKELCCAPLPQQPVSIQGAPKPRKKKK